jgi:hypothetical protein
VNSIKGLGEEIDEYVIVQKYLRSLPMRFDSKISALEERTYLSTITMDELHGTLKTYGMRIEHENPFTKEEAFKESKKDKKKQAHKSK